MNSADRKRSVPCNQARAWEYGGGRDRCGPSLHGAEPLGGRADGHQMITVMDLTTIVIWAVREPHRVLESLVLMVKMA